MNSILDVFSTSSNVDQGLKKRSGLDGNLVVSSKVVPIIAADEIIEESSRSFFGQEKSEQVRTLEASSRPQILTPKDCHLLCVEDSSFFRKQLKRLLAPHGFRLS